MNTGSLLYLWDRRSLFIGKLGAPLKLCQGAACLIVSLGKPFLYRNAGEESFREAQSVLIPAGCDNEIDVRGELVANCMLDPFGEDYAMLRSVFQDSENGTNKALINSPQTEHYVRTLQYIYEHALSYDDAYKALDEALQTGTNPDRPPHPIDTRIVLVVEELKNRVHENLSIDDLANLANVSVSRLVQLFKKQTGIPIRRYRCWHRLFVASAMMAKTGNLTHAAVVAGFTDASHFTKTFYSMAGMCPSLILSRPGGVKLFVQEN